MTMTYTETRSHYLCLVFRVRSSVKIQDKRFLYLDVLHGRQKAIVNDVFEKFHDRFGFYPESTGSYYMDADLTSYIKATYPTVKCAVATCWEEGPKAYVPATTPGIPYSMAVHGLRGSRQTEHMRRQQQRMRTAVSLQSASVPRPDRML